MKTGILSHAGNNFNKNGELKTLDPESGTT
jgi:hypothetical protein